MDNLNHRCEMNDCSLTPPELFCEGLMGKKSEYRQTTCGKQNVQALIIMAYIVRNHINTIISDMNTLWIQTYSGQNRSIELSTYVFPFLFFLHEVKFRILTAVFPFKSTFLKAG